MRQAAADVGENLTGCSDVVAVGGCSDLDIGAIVSRLCCFSCSNISKAVEKKAQPSTPSQDTDVHTINSDGNAQGSNTSQSRSAHTVSNHSSGQSRDAPATRQSTDARAGEQTSGHPSTPPAPSQDADDRTARSDGDDRSCRDDDGGVTADATRHNATGITGCRDVAGRCSDIWVARMCCATCANSVCEDNH